MNAVQNFSPGTIVRYEASRHYVASIEDPSNVILDRVFWAFKPCIEGFAYCKPILQVDGTFLTGKYSGTLSIASSQDGYELMRPRFERMLSALREKNLRAGAWLDQIPKEKWAQCYDEWRRDEAVNMIKAGHIYCEKLTNVMKENQRKSTCQLVRSLSKETGVAEVEAPSRSSGRHSKVYTVKLTESWCDCGEFQSLRLPCSYAIATCSTLNLDCGQYISPIYRLDNILKVYGLEFQPIGNEEY
ncbi:hypothetical protein Lal_00047949 [Lupinus albus]|nr:hypothetical protein Lal_00047949 [Lupinus albus]